MSDDQIKYPPPPAGFSFLSPSMDDLPPPTTSPAFNRQKTEQNPHGADDDKADKPVREPPSANFTIGRQLTDPLDPSRP